VTSADVTVAVVVLPAESTLSSGLMISVLFGGGLCAGFAVRGGGVEAGPGGALRGLLGAVVRELER